MIKIFDELQTYNVKLPVQKQMLETINQRFCVIHETPTKELTELQKAELHVLRRLCQQLGDVGYSIVKSNRKLKKL